MRGAPQVGFFRESRRINHREVATGSHTRVWDGRDEQGREVASGIYFYELDVEGKRMSSKLVQVR